MGYFDAQQVCLNGHQVTDMYQGSPQLRRDYCEKCGAKTIHTCPNCNTEIKGDYHTDGVIAIGFSTPVPKFCEKCGKPFPWAERIDGANGVAMTLDSIASVERICSRIALVVPQLRVRHENRQTLDVIDEYDLQDVLNCLLLLFFDDVRPEEYTPSCAGKATRMDFLLKNESIVIEAKMTRKGLGAKEIGEQLIVDIAHYRAHPNCKKLFCLVYDPEHRITNPHGLENDLSKVSEGLDVRVFVVPRGQ